MREARVCDLRHLVESGPVQFRSLASQSPRLISMRARASFRKHSLIVLDFRSGGHAPTVSAKSYTPTRSTPYRMLTVCEPRPVNR